MSDRRLFFNEDKAHELINATDDPTEQTLLKMALTKLRLLAIKESSLSPEEANGRILPQTPFDLYFYLKAIQDLFDPSIRPRIKGILDGDIEAAKDMPDLL